MMLRYMQKIDHHAGKVPIICVKSKQSGIKGVRVRSE